MPTIDKPETELAHHEDNLRRLIALETKMDVNTALTKGLTDDTRELLDLFSSVRSGLKVMGWLGALAKWVAGIIAAFAAVYAFLQNLKGH